MNELALFAGAGGGILGGKLLGWRTVCAVENNEYCRNVLVARQNDGTLRPFPIWDDVRTFDGWIWRGLVDVVSGGFPCQAWSTAARGRNVARNYWPEMFRIIGEIEPSFVFAENVDEGAIIAAQKDLADVGYETCRVEISAADVGADHIRKRWWLGAYSNHKSKLGREIDAEVDWESECCCRVWETYTRDTRVDNGMAYKMDRLKAIGNGQVPAVAALAWRVLRQRIGLKKNTMESLQTAGNTAVMQPGKKHDTVVPAA